jgi:hypothetical protein
MQCVTPKTGIVLDKRKDLLIECKYINRSRVIGISEVECIIENNGTYPETIVFEKVSLSEPDSTIIPVDANKFRTEEALRTVVVVLGVVLIIGALVVWASKSKSRHVPSVHVNIPYTHSVPRALAQEDDSRKTFSLDTIQIAAQGSASLVFKIKHGTIRPNTLVLQLGGIENTPVEVPIKETAFGPKGRSHFDY